MAHMPQLPLLCAGHASELAQLAAAAEELPHSSISLSELSGLLSRTVQEFSAGGSAGDGTLARALARAARHPPGGRQEEGLKQLSHDLVATSGDTA